MPSVKEVLWIAGLSLVTVAIVARTPLAPYVDGTKKILGVV